MRKNDGTRLRVNGGSVTVTRRKLGGYGATPRKYKRAGQELISCTHPSSSIPSRSLALVILICFYAQSERVVRRNPFWSTAVGLLRPLASSIAIFRVISSWIAEAAICLLYTS